MFTKRLGDIDVERRAGFGKDNLSLLIEVRK